MKRIRSILKRIYPVMALILGLYASIMIVCLFPAVLRWFWSLGLFIIWVGFLAWVIYEGWHEKKRSKFIKAFRLTLVIWFSFLISVIFLLKEGIWVKLDPPLGCLFFSIFLAAALIAWGAAAFLHDLLNEKNKPECEPGTVIN